MSAPLKVEGHQQCPEGHGDMLFSGGWNPSGAKYGYLLWVCHVCGMLCREYMRKERALYWRAADNDDDCVRAGEQTG